MWWLLPGHAKDWLVFDIDDSACDFVGPCYSKLNAHLGTDLKMGDHPNYWVNEHFGMKGPEFHEVCGQVRLHAELEPLDGLVDALLKLSRYFKIGFNTHRGSLPNGREITQTWLNQHRFPMDNLTVLKHGEPKHEHFPERTRLFVEDNANNAMAAAESGKCDIVFLIDKPWNQGIEHPRMVRIQHDQLVPMLLAHYIPKSYNRGAATSKGDEDLDERSRVMLNIKKMSYRDIDNWGRVSDHPEGEGDG